MKPSIPWAALGFGLIFIHQLDEAFVHSEANGVVTLLVTLVIAVLLLLFYERIPRMIRVVVLVLIGLNAVIQGYLGHLVHIFDGNSTAIDWTGILFVLGGLVLLADAVRNLMQSPPGDRP